MPSYIFGTSSTLDDLFDILDGKKSDNNYIWTDSSPKTKPDPFNFGINKSASSVSCGGPGQRLVSEPPLSDMVLKNVLILGVVVSLKQIRYIVLCVN